MTNESKVIKPEDKKYLKPIGIAGYGLGEVGFACQYLFSSFYMIFLTTMVGLNPAIIGTLIMVSKFLDGISDVIAGVIIDHTHTKWGKARPWMFVSCFPLGICQLLLFFIPGEGKVLPYVYFFILYCLINAVFFTMGSIAYNAFNILVTRNPVERVTMGTSRTLCAMVASSFISSIAMFLVQALGAGVMAWRITAAIFSALVIILNLICVFTIKELPQEDTPPATKGEEEKNKDKLTFKQIVKALLDNKYYLLIFAYYLLFYISSGVLATVGAFYAQFVLGAIGLYGILALAGNLPGVFSSLVAPVMARKLGIHKSNIICIILSLIGCVPMVIGGLTGNMVLLIVGLILKCFFMGPIGASLYAIVADTATYTEVKDGLHLEGTMYSCVSMGNKIGQGIGSAVCGWVLSLAGFVETASVQGAAASMAITAMYVVVPAVITLVTAFVLYKLDVKSAIEKLRANKTVEAG